MDLHPDLRAFAISFLTSPTPRSAAEAAGLPASSGSRYFRDPVVRAYIGHLQDIQSENAIISVQHVQATILHFMEIFAGEKEAPTVVPGVGLMMEKKLYAPELVRLIDMMAKSVGFYNADLSQNSMMQFIQMMQETGRKHQLESEPVDPKSFRVIECDADGKPCA